MSISETAFALLSAHQTGETKLTRKAGSFLGQLVTDPQPLSDKQAEWIATLLERASLPQIGEAPHG
jgi:hypothetical protein